jgi:hypothetical protein
MVRFVCRSRRLVSTNKQLPDCRVHRKTTSSYNPHHGVTPALRRLRVAFLLPPLRDPRPHLERHTQDPLVVQAEAVHRHLRSRIHGSGKPPLEQAMWLLASKQMLHEGLQELHQKSDWHFEGSWRKTRLKYYVLPL